MAMLQVLGDALVTREQLATTEVIENLAAFAENPDNTSVELPTGTVSAENIITEVPVGPEGTTVPFEPVGLGKPLTVEIRHVYTGTHPGVFTRDVFGHGADMLFTSAMRSTAISDAQPRALNFLKRDLHPRTLISGPEATENGTTLVYYTPALVERSSVLTLEMAFDQFNEEIVNALSSLFGQAAGLPVFLSGSTPLGPALLASSEIIKLGGQIAKNLIENGPVFKKTESLPFFVPGRELPVADYKLILERDMDQAFYNQYKVNADGVLSDCKTREPYQGPIPYAVISLDGHSVPEYEKFTPTAASAELLGRFYNMGQGHMTLEPLIKGLELYNDHTFRHRADELAGQIKKLKAGTPASDPAYAEMLRDYQAAVKNIRDERLRPSEDPEPAA